VWDTVDVAAITNQSRRVCSLMIRFNHGQKCGHDAPLSRTIIFQCSIPTCHDSRRFTYLKYARYFNPLVFGRSWLFGFPVGGYPSMHEKSGFPTPCPSPATVKKTKADSQSSTGHESGSRILYVIARCTRPAVGEKIVQVVYMLT
jgi:hypothetical protein